MATNIEMNVMQNDGQYETIYPQTTSENIVDLQTTLSNYYTKAETLQGSTAQLYGLDTNAIPDTVFSTIKTLIDTAQSTADSVPKTVFGSYVGTGKGGINNPNSLSADFPMKIVWIYGFLDTGGRFVTNSQMEHYMVPVEKMSVDNYNDNVTLGEWQNALRPYGKRTSDSKQIFWYNEASDQSIAAERQYNKSGYTYFYIIWG